MKFLDLADLGAITKADMAEAKKLFGLYHPTLSFASSAEATCSAVIDSTA